MCYRAVKLVFIPFSKNFFFKKKEKMWNLPKIFRQNNMRNLPKQNVTNQFDDFFSTPMHEVINLPKNLIWYQLFYVKLKRLKDLKNIQNWTYLFRKSSYLVSKMEIGRWKPPQSKRKLIILSFQCFDIRQFSLNPWTTSEFRLFLNDFFCWWIS